MDADHIRYFTRSCHGIVDAGVDVDGNSAIDNATRALISLGQLPVTCGLFFSLGHSSIVIVVVSTIPFFGLFPSVRCVSLYCRLMGGGLVVLRGAECRYSYKVRDCLAVG